MFEFDKNLVRGITSKIIALIAEDKYYMVRDFLLVTTHYPIGTVKDYLYEQSKSGNQYS